MGTSVVILAAVVLFALFAPKRGRVTEVTNLRRGLREKWRGVKDWPTGIQAPKFKAGQKVTVRIPPEPSVEPDKEVEGKTATVVELVYSEVVEVKPDGTQVTVAGPGKWAYVLDLKVADQPVRVDESSLVPEGTAAAGDGDTDWIFDVEYLKQVWPLIEGGRANTATLRKALKIAAALDSNIAFTQQGTPEDVALVTEMLAYLRQNVAAAGVEENPTHGRTARCKKAKWSEIATKILREGTKAIFSSFTGGSGGKALDAAYDAMHLGTANVKADELAAFLNTSSNADVYLWALSWARERVTKVYADTNKKRAASYLKILQALHITMESFGALDTATRATFKMMLWLAKLNWGPLPSQFVDCVLQAMLLIEYKAAPLSKTWEIVSAALKKRPNFDSRKADTLTDLSEWADATLRSLEQYRDKPQPTAEKTE